MNLIDRQILAVRETLKQVREEYVDGEEFHNFCVEDCSLCEEFRTSFCSIEGSECPIYLFSDGCLAFTRTNDYSTYQTPLEDIAGFLKSLEISLEMMR